MTAPNVRLEAWGPGDFALLEQLLGDPAMTEHIGGPETHEQLMERQARYEVLTDPAEGGTFKIVDASTGVGVGWTGYWGRSWHDQEVYETGWFVLPAHQGRGIASAGTALAIDAARAQRRHRHLHAFPSVDNPASNAICRKLGFELIEATDLEYPAGNRLRCNDWRLDLFADG